MFFISDVADFVLSSFEMFVLPLLEDVHFVTLNLLRLKILHCCLEISTSSHVVMNAVVNKAFDFPV